MKKTISTLLCAALLMSPACALADTASGLKDVITSSESSGNIKISIPQVNKYNIIEGTSFDVQVDVEGSKETTFYTVECLINGESYGKDNISATRGSTVSKELHVTNAVQGMDDIEVNIYSGGRLVGSEKINAMVITPYEKSFMDEFSRRGICGVPKSDNTQGDDAKYYYDLIGFNNLRQGNEWNGIEQTKGVYDFSGMNPVDNRFFDNYSPIIYLATYNNPIYSGISVSEDMMARQYGAKTTENFVAYGNYLIAAANYYPTIKYMEYYNEPNIGFWKPINNYVDYTYMCEIGNRMLKEEKPYIQTAVGVTAGANSVFTENMMKIGAYPNVDAVSIHPYVYPSKVDEATKLKFDDNERVITKYGGWKELIVTECGWPTHEGSTGSTVEKQAVEFVKYYIVADSCGCELNQIYRMNDPGTRITYNEDNFGILYYAMTPKPAVATIKNLFQKTNNGQYVGEMELDENQIAHLYMHDGQVTAVVWQKAGTESTVCNLGEKATFSDMYGNVTGSGDTLTLTEEPIYAEGLSLDVVADNLAYNAKRVVDEHFDILENECEIGSSRGYADVRAIIDNEIDKLASINSLPSEEDALSILEEYFAVGDEIMEMYKDGRYEVSQKDLSATLYSLYEGGQYVMKMYMASCGSELGDYETLSDKKIKESESIIEKNSEIGTLPYAEAIWKFAYYLNDDKCKVEKLSENNVMKAGVIKAWDRTSQILSDWAIEMSEFEDMSYDNILLQLPSAECTVETYIEKTIYPGVHNYSDKTLKGYVELIDPDGEVVAKTDNFEIESKSYKEVPMKMFIEEVKDTKENNYKLRLVSDGKTIKENPAMLKVLESLSVKLEPADRSIDSLNEISVTVTSLVETSFSGNVVITPPEGWALSSTKQEVSLDAGESKTITFAVAQKAKTPYNYYDFNVQVKNSSDHTVFNQNVPLSFIIVTKSNKEYYVENFDGDISDWNDAYPLYIGLPEDSSDIESWSEASNAARAMFKWDSNYFYVMVDVFDDAHIQSNSGSQMWDGDNVQMSFDPEDANADYNTKCYEYGWAYSDKNGNEGFAWAKNGGELPSEWSVMLRDNDLKLSRYLIKIPKADLAPLDLSEGSTFGMNIGVNDADWSSRERYIEYVRGTIAAKNPAVYPTFTLVSSENASGINNCPIPSTMSTSAKSNVDDVAVSSSFDDIKGHWAEEVINKMSDKNYVSGTGENQFEPDRKITRAEFVQLLANVTGFDKSSDQKVTMFSVEDSGKKEVPKAYYDVSSDAWYAAVVYNAKIAGILDDNIADVFFTPDNAITREETFHLINNYLKIKGDDGSSMKPLTAFLDDENISEWAVLDAMNLYGKGIISGDGDNKLNPKNSLTRAEATQCLSALLNN